MTALANPVEDSLHAPYSDVQVQGGDFSLAQVENLEGNLLQFPQAEVPLTHMFAPGVYWREVLMRKGTFVIGHQHKTEHFNVVLTGKAKVLMDGVMHYIQAPCVLVSKPNVRKLLYIEEDVRWATIHVSEETDLDKLADLLIVKSDTFLGHHRE